MIRVSSLAIVCAFAISLSAAADSSKYERVDAEFTYDASLLETDAGAEKVFSKIVRKTANACKIRAPFTGRALVDDVCQKDLIFQAVKQISNERLSTVYAASNMKIEEPARVLDFASL